MFLQLHLASVAADVNVCDKGANMFTRIEVGARVALGCPGWRLEVQEVGPIEKLLQNTLQPCHFHLQANRKALLDPVGHLTETPETINVK